jgi:hypothetical protein
MLERMRCAITKIDARRITGARRGDEYGIVMIVSDDGLSGFELLGGFFVFAEEARKKRFRGFGFLYQVLVGNRLFHTLDMVGHEHHTAIACTESSH